MTDIVLAQQACTVCDACGSGLGIGVIGPEMFGYTGYIGGCNSGGDFLPGTSGGLVDTSFRDALGWDAATECGVAWTGLSFNAGADEGYGDFALSDYGVTIYNHPEYGFFASNGSPYGGIVPGGSNSCSSFASSAEIVTPWMTPDGHPRRLRVVILVEWGADAAPMDEFEPPGPCGDWPVCLWKAYIQARPIIVEVEQ